MTQEELQAQFGFTAPDLSGAETATELAGNALQFDHEDYIDLEAISYGISQLTNKPGKKASCKELSVNGKVINDRMDKYLAHAGESSSALKEALKSPRHYLIYKNENLKPKDESHFTLGTFIHSAFLEPNKFDKVKVLPEAGKNTLEGVRTLIKFYWTLLQVEQSDDLSGLTMLQLKEILSGLEEDAAAEGYTFIKQEDADIIRIIKSSYMTYANGIIPLLVKNGRTETSMYGVDKETGLKVKIRPDCMLLEEQVGANIILSVKTTSATTIEAFMRDAAKFRYELAEGMYLQVASEITGRHFSGTIMLVAQTVIPFQCFLLWLDAEDLQIGKYKYRQALDVVKQAKETSRYPGFECYAEEGSFGLITARFPDYIKNEVNPQNI